MADAPRALDEIRDVQTRLTACQYDFRSPFAYSIERTAILDYRLRNGADVFDI